MMNIDPNDPRLTAYALNELDEAERAEVAALVEQSEDARRIVEEIRATAELLTTELQNEPVAGGQDETAARLSESQRAAVEAKAAGTNGSASKADNAVIAIRRWRGATLASAASVLIVAGTWIVVRSWDEMRRTLSPAGVGSRVVAENGLVGDEASILDSEAAGIRTGRASGAFAGDEDGESVRNGPVGLTDPLFTFDTSAGGVFLYSMDKLMVDTPAQGAPARKRRSSGRDQEENWKPKVYFGPAPNSFAFAAGGVARGDEAFNAYVEFEQDVSAYGNISYCYEVPYSDFPPRESGSETYDSVTDNPFNLVSRNPLSTFSIDVDTASYANVRRFLKSGQMPRKGAVRIEEMVNYFHYDYPQPTGDDPFSVNVDVAECPWEPDHLLARIGLKGWEVAEEDRPPANLVFLIDVSGSMDEPNKLPLVVSSMRMLVEELSADDRVAMVVYAGESGLVLPSTSCDSKSDILEALQRLQSGGSTNGGAGIQLAYDVAEENFIEGGINRVILATDGDFNVGTTDRGSLTELIEEKAAGGVFLSVLGFGMGNYNDATLETLADKGNGNYAYIDTAAEAEKVLIEQMGGTLITIAKDVKIQVEFNPLEVLGYRLIGYENRVLAAQDFNDDTKDAGEIGAGHTVTAFYELYPADAEGVLPDIDPLKYQTEPNPSPAAECGELMTVKLRYKEPDGDTSKLIEFPVTDDGLTLADMSDDFVFAASVASFGMILRDSRYMGDSTLAAVAEMAGAALGDDEYGYRAEFLELVELAAQIKAASETP